MARVGAFLIRVDSFEFVDRPFFQGNSNDPRIHANQRKMRYY